MIPLKHETQDNLCKTSILLGSLGFVKKYCLPDCRVLQNLSTFLKKIVLGADV
jgi:hypothetical protein